MHTPGPWHFAADADGTMTTNGNGAQIAMWPPQGGTIEQCANARLIAKAPDLKAALAWALDQIEDDLDPDHQAALAHARSLLED